MRNEEPGKTVWVWLMSSQSAAMARVRCGELSGASVTFSSVFVTSKSAVLLEPSLSYSGVVSCPGSGSQNDAIKPPR